MKKFFGYFLIIFAFIVAGITFLQSNIELPYFGGIYNKVIINRTSNVLEIFNGHKFYGVSNFDADAFNLLSIIGTNFRGIFTAVMIFILSLFMVPKIYIFSYLLFFAGLIILNPQKVSPKITLGIILLLALLLRLCGLGEYPMWIDEVFTVLFARSGWRTVLNDYCNPPVFYIVSKLWIMITPYSETVARLISVIAGVGGVWSIYYMLKRKFSEKTALVGAILMCLSFWGIYYSQELRCYAVIMLLSPLCAISMFNMLEQKRNRDFVWFGILSAIIINTHLYGILFVASNFVYAIFKHLRDKRFYLLIFLVCLSFLPYLCVTFFKHSIMGNNAIIGNMFFESIKIILLFVFLSFGVGIFVLLAKLFKKTTIATDKEKDFLKYCLYSVLSVFALSFIISIFRPIIYYRYYSVIYPFILAIIAIVISQDWKTKYNGVILTALVLVNIFFQFSVKFPPSLRYGNFYDVIIFEKANGLTKKNIVVVLDYLTYYSKYYDLKGVTTMVPQAFDLDKIEKDTTIYLMSFKGSNQDIEGKRIKLPDNTELIRIDK
ncbi:glycosyltransferase family 39 protein [bacterium]|nr:glycosyltransferase family 39 protein [bacterium]